MKSPLSLRLAASLAALESVVLLVVAVVGLINPSNAGVALGLGALYIVVALGLGLAAVGLWECRSWGRAPVVLAQLVMAGVAWDVREHAIAVAVLAGALAVAALASLFHPASTRALAGHS